MNLAEPQEVLPFTIFGSARYRSSNSEHHRREPVTAELWNTADWGRMGRRFPHWGLGAWECQPLTDQRTKKNRFEFFADMWSLAATSWIRPKSTARTKTRNCSGVSCARSRARVSSSQLSLASALIRTFQSKKPLARWPNSFPQARSERLAFQRQVRKRCGARRKSIRLRRCKASIRFGRVTW